jgi:hypothetical protein
MHLVLLPKTKKDSQNPTQKVAKIGQKGTEVVKRALALFIGLSPLRMTQSLINSCLVFGR